MAVGRSVGMKIEAKDKRAAVVIDTKASISSGIFERQTDAVRLNWWGTYTMYF